MLFTSAASSDMNIPKGLAAIAATIITTIRTTNRIATPTQPKAAKMPVPLMNLRLMTASFHSEL